jgi:hypothetical protein
MNAVIPSIGEDNNAQHNYNKKRPLSLKPFSGKTRYQL